MPELPEVETIRVGLQKYLVGHTIESIEVHVPKMVTGEVHAVVGAKVTSIERFGKGLVINLDNDYSIAIHIKMTGQLIYQGPNAPKQIHMATSKVGKTLPNNSTHVIFHLDRSGILYYNDIRRFGWVKIVKSTKVQELVFFKELGPELPVLDSKHPGKALVDLEQFKQILKKKKTAVKPLLMDQKQIGGIGNIYANDGLYVAKILPTRPANSLSNEEIEKLFNALLTVMKKGFEVGGASEWQYVNALGEAGGYQNYFQVYGQDGKPCKVCSTKIKRINVGGRGTFYCEHCQK